MRSPGAAGVFEHILKLFFSMVLFDSPENIQKIFAFLMCSGHLKANIGEKEGCKVKTCAKKIEGAVQKCSLKKLLLKILPYSQESNWEYRKIFNNTIF